MVSWTVFYLFHRYSCVILCRNNFYRFSRNAWFAFSKIICYWTGSSWFRKFWRLHCFGPPRIDLLNNIKFRVFQKFILFRKQPPEVFYKKHVLKNFARFRGKQPCWSLFFNNFVGVRPQAIPFIQNNSRQLFNLNPFQDGGAKSPPTSFLPCNFYNVRISNKKFLTSSCNPLPNWCKISRPYLASFKRTPQKMVFLAKSL